MCVKPNRSQSSAGIGCSEVAYGRPPLSDHFGRSRCPADFILGIAMLKAVISPAAVLLAAAAMVGVGSTDSARAQSFKYNTAIDALEAQCMVAHRMVAEAVLVALDFERDSNVARLTRSRDQFDDALRRLSDGSSEIGARAAADPVITEQVDETTELWRSLERAIGDHIAAETVTAEHVENIAALGQSLHEAVGDLAEEMRHSRAAEAHGMLSNAIETAVRAETLSQRMTKEFLFIAYGFRPDNNRFALRNTAEQFHLALLGLMQGDIDQRLLPAPTPEILAQLERVERYWQEEYRPLIDRAIDFEEIDAAG